MSWRTITDYLKHSQTVLRLADYLGRGRGRMRFLDELPAIPKPRKPDLTKWHKQSAGAIWLGHATLLIRLAGKTILTDPVFGNRVGIGMGLITGGPLRRLAPALSLAELPAIDLILISHAHFDHLDRPTLCRLPKETPVVTAHQTADLVRDLGFRNVDELSWSQSLATGDLRITARQVRHWGARTFFDSYRGYNAYLLESLATSHRIFYGGDSAYHDYYKDMKDIDLAILGIGGYDPYVAAHATPEQAWEMANHMGAANILPMHHSTFRLSHEPTGEPMERLLAAAGKDAGRVVVHEVGGQWGVD